MFPIVLDHPPTHAPFPTRAPPHRLQLKQCTHFGGEQRRLVVRLVSLLSAYAVHDPETSYCQG